MLSSQPSTGSCWGGMGARSPPILLTGEARPPPITPILGRHVLPSPPWPGVLHPACSVPCPGAHCRMLQAVRSGFLQVCAGRQSGGPLPRPLPARSRGPASVVDQASRSFGFLHAWVGTALVPAGDPRSFIPRQHQAAGQAGRRAGKDVSLEHHQIRLSSPTSRPVPPGSQQGPSGPVA